MVKVWDVVVHVLHPNRFGGQCNLYWCAQVRNWSTIVWNSQLNVFGGVARGERGEVATPIMHLENVSPELQQNILYSVAVFEKPQWDTYTRVDIICCTLLLEKRNPKIDYFDYFWAILNLHRLNILTGRQMCTRMSAPPCISWTCQPRLDLHSITTMIPTTLIPTTMIRGIMKAHN